MKNLCKSNNIPTANFGIFDNITDASAFIEINELKVSRSFWN